METQAQELAAQKKVELKDEMTKELVTKADFLGEMKALREEIKTVDTRFQGEIKVLREEMKSMNLKINFLIVLMILALTAMNPVVAELLKKWLKL